MVNKVENIITIKAILGLIVTEQGKISVFNGKDVNAETKEHV